MKVLGVLIALLILAAPLWGRDSELTVFLPAGAQAHLVGAGSDREVVSGVPLACDEGSYTLTVTHPDYAAFSRVVKVGPTDVVVFPWLELSASFRAGQVTSLRVRKQKATDDRNSSLTTAALLGASALAGWGAVGGLEYLLAGKKTDLGAAQDRYRAASATEAPGLWAGVESLKVDIAGLRAFENYTLGASGALTIGSLVFLVTAPDISVLDDRIREMGEKAE